MERGARGQAEKEWYFGEKGGECRMNFYDSWIYREVLNAAWFVRVCVVAVLLANVVMPVVIWYLFSSRMPFKKLRERWKRKGAASRSSGD